MIITTEIWLTAEIEQSRDSNKITVEFEHDLTRRDLNEFVREKGFDDYKSYFSHHITDNDALSEVLLDIKKGNVFLIESDIKIHCGEFDELKKFILNKYQFQMCQAFLRQIDPADYYLINF